MPRISPSGRVSSSGKIGGYGYSGYRGRSTAYETYEQRRARLIQEQQRQEAIRQQARREAQLKAQEETLQKQKSSEQRRKTAQRNINEIMQRDPYLTKSSSKRAIKELIQYAGLPPSTATQIIQDANKEYAQSSLAYVRKEQAQAKRYGFGEVGAGTSFDSLGQGMSVKTPIKYTYEPSSMGFTGQQINIPKQQVKEDVISPTTKTEQSYGVVSAVEGSKFQFFDPIGNTFFREKVESGIRSLKGKQTSTGSFKDQLYGTGITGLTLLKVPLDFAYTLRHPIKTAESYYTLATDPLARKQFKSQVTSSVKYNPQESVTYAVGSLWFPKVIEKAPAYVSDTLRNRKLIEIPGQDVIAPEYFQGQNYPAIKKGQTAGELLREFKQPEQYGVTKLSDFTASSTPFGKMTEAGVGSSELPGVYQAPKISPNFLRISGEGQKFFSLNPFDTLRPSVMQILPESFELVKGVSKGQKGFGSLPKSRMFFENLAEKGKSYIPFIKSEKEAIIPAGTGLELVDKRFFFKFEGRKVPIYEFKTIPDLTKGTGKVSGTIGDLVPSYSRGLGSQKGFVTPLDIKYLGNYGSKSSYAPPKVNNVILPSSSKVYRKDVKFLPSSSYRPKPSRIRLPYSSMKPSSSKQTSSSNMFSPSNSRIFSSSRVGGSSGRITPRGSSSSSSSSRSIPTPSIIYPPRKEKVGFAQPKKKGQIWDIFVRKKVKGKYRFVYFKSTFGSIKRATNLGEIATEESLLRSFRVKRRGAKQFTKLKPIRNIFRRPKKKKGKTQDFFTMVEKSKYALDKPGEKYPLLTFLRYSQKNTNNKNQFLF